MLLKEQLVLFSNSSIAILIVLVTVFCPCGIFIESSPETDIFSIEVEELPEDDELEEPPDEDELELEELPEDDELEELLEDELEEEPPEDEDELVLEEPPEEDELEELLDEDSIQSAKPKQLAGFVGQHPFIQQSGPHCVNMQSS